MSDSYILAIDQGTTGTTVGLVNSRGQLQTKVNKEFPQIFPKPGWVEHNPEDIWRSTLYGIKKIFSQSKIKPQQIQAIGITNQRETVALWDRKTGKPVYNAIVWQCRRTTEICQKLKAKGYESIVKKKTGLVLDPYFSATKIHWILKNTSSAKNIKNLAAGTVDSYLLWKLTNGKAHKTDYSNASRTSLLNIKTGLWDPELGQIFRVPLSILPEVTDCNAPFGVTHKVPGLPDGIPIHGMIGDQQSALFGQTCFREGEAKCTFGTGSFILMNTGDKKLTSKSGVLTTVAWKLTGQRKIQYALEGGAFICGATVQWLRDGLEFFKSSSEVEKWAQKVSDTGGVELVPAFAGLGAPYWDPEARGMISGITRGTTKAHISRAALEAMALQNVDILQAMEKDLGKKLKNLKVDGGATANNLLMQLQSDYLGQTIYRPQWVETTAMGAAYMAGLGVGMWSSTAELKKVSQVDKKFQPKITAAQRKKRLQSWHQAVNKCLHKR